MKNRTRYLATIGVFLLLLGVWLSRIWFPSAKEADYQVTQTWGRPGDAPGEFSEPIGIAVSRDEVFVSDAGNNRIQVFDKSGALLRQFGQEGTGLGDLGRPMGYATIFL